MRIKLALINDLSCSKVHTQLALHNNTSPSAKLQDYYKKNEKINEKSNVESTTYAAAA